MILVTGGAGFIGSHTCVALAQAGIPFMVLDNLCNSRRSVLERVERITGAPVPFIEGDIRDTALLQRVFAEHAIEGVIHFAALKSVGESVREPLRYYDNNVAGTVALLGAMRAANVRTLVFSSSATVYGDPASVPIREDFPLSATNAYGWSKLMMEQVLADVDASEPGQWRIARLRYFNPVGAHASGLIGEDPQDIPNNLLPYVAQVAVGLREQLSVYGNDYPTPDGTGVRDYIHVMDLAEGHRAALAALAGMEESSQPDARLLTVNLGTGQGYSVLEMVEAFAAVSGRAVPYRFAPRRPGDIAACYAQVSKAAYVLGWQARCGLREMCASAWTWQIRSQDRL